MSPTGQDTTTNGSRDDAGASGPTAPGFTLRSAIAAHKRATAGVVAVLVVAVALPFVPPFLGPRGVAHRDSTSCSQWSSASQAQQTAYSHLYFSEHVADPSGASDAGSITTAITDACIQAAYLGEADDMSVLAAIEHQY